MMAFPAERTLLSHNGVQGDSTTHLEKALNATKEYHQGQLEKLDKGVQKEDVCKERSDFVISLGALAYENIISFLCNLLLKHSQKEREKDLFEIPKAVAA